MPPTDRPWLPVAAVAVGNARNAGLLAVRILGATDAQLRKRMEALQEQLGASVLEKDAALRDRVLGADGKVTGE